MSNPKNLSLSDANQALENVTEWVEELLTIIASNPDLTVIIERQETEIKRLTVIIEEQKTEIKRLRKNSPPVIIEEQKTEIKRLRKNSPPAF